LKFTLYHGTDEEFAKKIQSEGFKVKESRDHWLGNGIYFFLDEELARWWTTKPMKKFGPKTTSPVIIKCDYTVNEDSILDLRKFTDYTFCYDRFRDFYTKMYEPYIAKNRIDIIKLRCAFFDWLFDIYKYKAIVGTFSPEEQSYYKPFKRAGSVFKHLGLVYGEVQVCISETQESHILNKQIIKVECQQR